MRSDKLILSGDEPKEANKTKKTSKLQSLIYHVDFAILEFSSKLWGLNLFKQEDHQRRTRTQIIFSASSLVALLIVYSMFGLIRALYYHYDYDYYVFHLNRLHQAKESNQSLSSLFQCDNTTRLEPYLTSQVKSKRQELYRIGSPLISAPTFSAECCYLTFIFYTLIVCFNLVFNLSGGRLRTNFIRFLDDPLEEQRRLNRWALQEVNKYLDSNYNFNQCYVPVERLVSSNTSHKDAKRADNQRPSTGCWPNKKLLSSHEARKLVVDYHQNVDILRSILRKGDIIKLYGFSAHWLTQTALFHCVNFVTTNLFYLMVSTVTVVGLGAESDAQEADSPAPSWSLSTRHFNELIASIQIMTQIVTFTYTGVLLTLMLVIDWKDELELMNRLRDLMVDCVNLNNRIYHGQQKSHKWDRMDYDKQWNMNSNLLFVLINYKIFPLRAKEFLKYQDNGANVSLRLMFVFPVVVRLHAPYCSPDVLLSLVSACVCNSVVTTLLMVFSSHLNDQTVQLHKPLAGLMAHVIQVNDEARRTTNVGVYSDNAVWCLRQELQDLSRFQEASLPESSPLNLRFTFPVLLKIQFWLYLLILSIFAQTKVDQTTASSHFMSDPLGLLNDQFNLNSWSATV